MKKFYSQFLQVTTANIPLEQENPLEKLKKEYQHCKLCSLCDNRTENRPTVFGIGPTNPRLMIIGEGPSIYEMENGSVFSDLINSKIYNLISYLSRSLNLTNNIYLTNAVMCPGKAFEEHFQACKKRLETEINIVNPKAILFLGKSVAKLLIEKPERLKKATIKLDKYHYGIVTSTLKELAVRRDSVKNEIQQDLDFLVKVIKHG